MAIGARQSGRQPALRFADRHVYIDSGGPCKGVSRAVRLRHAFPWPLFTFLAVGGTIPIPSENETTFFRVSTGNVCVVCLTLRLTLLLWF